MRNKILTINPGSTSTKIAVFCGEEKIWEKKIFHSTRELSRYSTIFDQYEFRLNAILAELGENHIKTNELLCISARGGLLHPLAGGTYEVNSTIIKELMTTDKQHASNLGAVIAKEMADREHIKAYIVDPVVVDEREPIAKISGIKGVERTSVFHALNHKAVGRQVAAELNKEYEECDFIIVHMGGGFSIGAHHLGRIIDNNNALETEGPFTPERSGGIPIRGFLRFVKNSDLDENSINKLLIGNGGLVSYLGTNDARIVEQMIKGGDEFAELVYKAMAYQISKEIGGYATVLKGRVDAIVLTGGIARSKLFTDWIKEQVHWIAPILVFPGEAEMGALNLGALRVLEGKESAKIYGNERQLTF